MQPLFDSNTGPPLLRRRAGRPHPPSALLLARPLWQAHPFDTEEGRAALTSPFAAGAFQSGGQQSSASSSQQPREPPGRARSAGDERRRQRRGAARRPYDSAGEQRSSLQHSSKSSQLSGTSMRSFIAAKCARIETKSLPAPGSGLPPATSADLIEAAEAGRARQHVTAPAAAGGARPEGAEVELQATPQSVSAEEAAEVAEGGDVMGAALQMRRPQPPRRTSSEEVCGCRALPQIRAP